LDLAPPCRERVDGAARHTIDVGQFVLRLLPAHSEPCRQLEAELRVVEMADRPTPREQRPRVERRPSLILGLVDEVGDHYVGVQMGLGGARRAMAVRRGQEPFAVQQPGSAVVAAAARHMLV
jgi:hypothetical protein